MNAKNSNPFAEMFKTFAEMRSNMSMDKETMLESHRKNMEALTEANKMAADVMQNMAKLQSQYIKKTFDDMNSMVKENMSANTNQHAWEKHAQRAKEQWNYAMEHGTKLTEAMSKHGNEFYSKMSKRVSDSLDDFKNATTRGASKTRH